MPTIRETYDDINEQRNSILEKSWPHHLKRQEIRSQIRELEAQENEIVSEIKKIEKPLYKLSIDLAGLARLLPEHKKIPALNGDINT